MIELAQGKELIQKIKEKINPGYDFEVVLTEEKFELTRFAESYIHQNVAESTLHLTLKVIIGDRIGSVRVDNLDKAAIFEGLQKAINIAHIVPPLNFTYRLIPHQNYNIQGKYSKDTANLSPKKKARIVKQIILGVGQEGFKAAGAFSSEQNTMMVGNSKGLFALDKNTKVDFNCVITKDGSTAQASFLDYDINHFKVDSIINELLETGLRNTEQIDLEPGIYTVILSPEATSDILNYTGYMAFNGKAIKEGKSFVCNYENEKIFPDIINLADDPFDELALPIPFDVVGYPREKVYLIEKGIVRDGVYDYLTALKYNQKCTGNTLSGEDASWGALPFNLALEGGTVSRDEMISRTERGILISRLHYVNVLNPMSAQLTGMTRDGTFLVEDGKISKAIKNMRFNTSVIDMFKAVDLISREREAKAGWVGSTVAPYIRTNNFTFSSKTSF